MNSETVELLDNCFRDVTNAPDRQARERAIEFRQGVMVAICTMTGADMETLYETYMERNIAAHERSIAREDNGE